LSAPEPPNRVILAPDLIGAAIFDPAARRVLQAWRDHQFKIVISRELLLVQIKLLRDLGLPFDLLQRWTLWLTSPMKSEYIADLHFDKPAPSDLCNALAEATNVQQIICWRLPKRDEFGKWISAVDFGARLSSIELHGSRAGK
jgi:hypothetical protein